MGRILIVLAILWLPITAFCQKKVSKKIVSTEQQFIRIDGTNCYIIDLQTSPGNQLVVEASIEGEYATDLALKLEEDGNTIVVSTDFLPSFKNPNDKLSAHKVISISLSVLLPEYAQVQLYGTYSNVQAKGIYNALDISVADGNCLVEALAEKSTVRTQTGEIRLMKTRGIVAAKTKYGKIHKGNVPSGDYNYSLHSIEGNIWVNVPMKYN
ncbi:MAG: hypothetical protein AAGF96_17775 [Bacteroidota bacterium]